MTSEDIRLLKYAVHILDLVANSACRQKNSEIEAPILRSSLIILGVLEKISPLDKISQDDIAIYLRDQIDQEKTVCNKIEMA